jgi:hypothetical protein
LPPGQGLAGQGPGGPGTGGPGTGGPGTGGPGPGRPGTDGPGTGGLLPPWPGSAGPVPAGRPGGREPARSRGAQLTAALDAAGRGDRDAALAQVAMLIAGDPLDADAHFISGLVTLEAGEPTRAVAALRRALYADPTFALAAFTLGRAFDALGDTAAARRAFERVLRTLDPDDRRHESILAQVDLGDIAAACRARLSGQPDRNPR